VVEAAEEAAVEGPPQEAQLLDRQQQAQMLVAQLLDQQ